MTHQDTLTSTKIHHCETPSLLHSFTVVGQKSYHLSPLLFRLGTLRHPPLCFVLSTTVATRFRVWSISRLAHRTHTIVVEKTRFGCAISQLAQSRIDTIPRLNSLYRSCSHALAFIAGPGRTGLGSCPSYHYVIRVSESQGTSFFDLATYQRQLSSRSLLCRFAAALRSSFVSTGSRRVS